MFFRNFSYEVRGNFGSIPNFETFSEGRSLTSTTSGSKGGDINKNKILPH